MRLALGLLLAVQLLLLILFPVLGHHAPPLDAVEMHTWASAPQLGYYKHPPFPAWVVFLSEAVFGRTSLALFVPSALSVVLATFALWPLAVRIVGARRAVAALFLQSTVAYYNLYATDYNHNVAQMPFWALAVTAFYFAINDGRKRWWCAFGAALGVAALGKYSAALLPLACMALLAWDRQARRHLSLVNVLCAASGFVMLFGPHIAWLVAHDFAPLHYLNDRVGALAATTSWSVRFWSFVGAQLIAHLALLGVWLAMRGKRGGAGITAARVARSAGQTRLDNRFLLALGLGPLALTVALALAGSYLHPMWASAMFPLSGLLVVRALGDRADRLLERRWCARWLILMLVIGSVSALKNTSAWPDMTSKFARAAYPGPELARLLDARWQAAAPGRALRTIVGTRWEAGVASFFSQYETLVVINADLSISPWVTRADVEQCGAIVTWDPWDKSIDFPARLRASFPQAKMLPNLEVDPDRPGTYYRKTVGAAVILPQPGVAASACPPR